MATNRTDKGMENPNTFEEDNLRRASLMETLEGRTKRTALINQGKVSPMTSILELSSQDVSAQEIEGPRVGVDLDEVDMFKQ